MQYYLDDVKTRIRERQRRTKQNQKKRVKRKNKLIYKNHLKEEYYLKGSWRMQLYSFSWLGRRYRSFYPCIRNEYLPKFALSFSNIQLRRYLRLLPSKFVKQLKSWDARFCHKRENENEQKCLMIRAFYWRFRKDLVLTTVHVKSI